MLKAVARRAGKAGNPDQNHGQKPGSGIRVRSPGEGAVQAIGADTPSGFTLRSYRQKQCMRQSWSPSRALPSEFMHPKWEWGGDNPRSE